MHEYYISERGQKQLINSYRRVTLIDQHSNEIAKKGFFRGRLVNLLRKKSTKLLFSKPQQERDIHQELEKLKSNRNFYHRDSKIA